MHATWPRSVTRLDVMPSEEGADAVDGTGTVAAFAADLHALAMRCLRAISRIHAAPWLLELAASDGSLERLDEAREPSLLRVNLYDDKNAVRPPSEDAQGAPAARGGGPCWHVDLGLLTVAPVGSWPALMASPFHTSIGGDSFLERPLDPRRDALVFAGTTLALALGGACPVLVHGVSVARLNRDGLSRIAFPYFLRARRGAVIRKPPHLDDPRWQHSAELLYPAVVEPEATGGQPEEGLDLLRFHRDLYGRLCTRGQVVPLRALMLAPDLATEIAKLRFA